jgi:tetratricopeptide (TPR) repeat protein
MTIWYYLVERHADIEHLRQLLQEHGRAAISTPTPVVGIYGMAGVGKTVLAQLLAHRLNNDYPDGVIWERLGPDVKTADQVQDILNRWARYAIGIEFNPNQPMRFEPDAVRTLLAEHPRLLIILDDVWSKAALDPLLDVIPAEAHLLITMRSRQLVIQMGIQEHQLDVLKDDEARELVARRLGWGNTIPDHARHWVDELITAVGRHTLALDVALGLLRLRGNATAWASEAHHIISAIRSGADFADLNLGADDREHHVELVLRYSYDHALDEEGRRYFRLLGAFASSADFSTAQAAALWQCDEKTACSRLNDFVNRSLLNRSDSDDDHWRQHPLLSGYARALLRRAGEYEAAAAHHAQIFATAMKEADDGQRFYTMKPYIPQLRHAFGWAIVNDLEQALDLIGHCARLQQTFELGAEHLQWCEQALQQAQRRGTPAMVARAQVLLGNTLQHAATLPGEDRAARLHATLAAYDEALRFRTAATVPLAYATTQNNRGACLQDLATLPGEDRAARLHAALAAYDEALRFLTAATVPLDYATTQNNRGACLQDLATLPGEDRAARLHAALAAYDEALRFRTAATVPLAYAATQNNRGACLQDLATLPGEDRAARLHAALAAYDEALRFRTAATVPLDYATTQTNRGNCLQDLATLPGEDRTARLHAALAAYDEALRFRTAATVPLAYATTQNNRGACLQDLATLPGEDRAARLHAALAAYWEAVQIFTAYQHAEYLVITRRALQQMRTQLGDEFVRLWEARFAEPLPDWLADPFTSLLNALLQVRDSQELVAFWQQVPTELEDKLIAAGEALLEQARQHGDEQFVQELSWRLEDFRQLCADQRARAADPRWQRVQTALQAYAAAVQAAEADEANVARWQAVVTAGEALRDPDLQGLEGVDWSALHAHLAHSYHQLGNALFASEDATAALAAYERATELQPDEAVYWRNRTAALIALGRLSEAAAALEPVMNVEP